MKKKINISISEELLQKLNEYAEKENMKKSNIKEKALQRFLKLDSIS